MQVPGVSCSSIWLPVGHSPVFKSYSAPPLRLAFEGDEHPLVDGDVRAAPAVSKLDDDSPAPKSVWVRARLCSISCAKVSKRGPAGGLNVFAPMATPLLLIHPKP